MATNERRRFTIDDFARMSKAGILRKEDRVELIDGDVLVLPPLTPLHCGIVRRVNYQFQCQPGNTAIVGVHSPVQLNHFTEPLPDVVLLRPRADYYSSRHPGPDDVLLIVEVADLRVTYDRLEKLPRYAEAGIPEVWLVDLEQFVVTQFTEPAGTAYRNERRHARGQTIECQSIAGLQVPADDILGPA